MKMTKRIAAVAACAVMTVTSMVGMSASATDVTTSNDVIYSMAAEGTWNYRYNGAYYNGTALVLLEGTSAETAKCTFNQVKVGNKLITGVATGAGLDGIYLSAVGGNGSVHFKSGNWGYVNLDKNGNPIGGLNRAYYDEDFQISNFTLKGNYGYSLDINGVTYTV